MLFSPIILDITISFDTQYINDTLVVTNDTLPYFYDSSYQDTIVISVDSLDLDSLQLSLILSDSLTIIPTEFLLNTPIIDSVILPETVLYDSYDTSYYLLGEVNTFTYDFPYNDFEPFYTDTTLIFDSKAFFTK